MFKKFKFSNHKIKVIFDKILPDEDKESIMLGAKENPKLMNLQKKIVETLKDYQNYCEPETKEYEINFKPHLTIAIDLDNKTYQKALEDIPPDFQIIGEIKEIVLAVVNNKTSEESKNPHNLHIFYL